MKLEFELNEIQSKALTELMPLLNKNNQVKDESDLARLLFVTFLIENKKKLIEQELR